MIIVVYPKRSAKLVIVAAFSTRHANYEANPSSQHSEGTGLFSIGTTCSLADSLAGGGCCFQSTARRHPAK